MIQTQKRSTKKQLQCALKVHTPATTFVDEVFLKESLQQRLGIRFEKTAIKQNNTEQSNPSKPPTRGGHQKPHKTTQSHT
jgi:pyruvate/2-oxoacid:ferredoxin oxidoreductase alpha subunit